MLDEAGQVEPGYSVEECDILQGDSVDQAVIWGLRTELPAGKGPLRLRFMMQNASLYSFKVDVPFAVGPDFDKDGDVDQEDFGHIQQCFSGEDVPLTDPACQAARLDGDEDVDEQDLSIFIGCMSGAGVPADPTCTE